MQAKTAGQPTLISTSSLTLPVTLGLDDLIKLDRGISYARRQHPGAGGRYSQANRVRGNGRNDYHGQQRNNYYQTSHHKADTDRSYYKRDYHQYNKHHGGSHRDEEQENNNKRIHKDHHKGADRRGQKLQLKQKYMTKTQDKNRNRNRNSSSNNNSAKESPFKKSHSEQHKSDPTSKQKEQKPLASTSKQYPLFIMGFDTGVSIIDIINLTKGKGITSVTTEIAKKELIDAKVDRDIAVTVVFVGKEEADAFIQENSKNTYDGRYLTFQYRKND